MLMENPKKINLGITFSWMMKDCEKVFYEKELTRMHAIIGHQQLGEQEPHLAVLSQVSEPVRLVAH